MCHLLRLLDIFSSLRTSIEMFLVRNLPQRLQCLLTRSHSSPSPGFESSISHIKKLIQTDDDTAIASALNDLRSWSPRPPVQVIPKGVWPNESTSLDSIQTHLKSSFDDAVNLLKATGRELSVVDESYLRLLLTHTCGWSATYPDHADDSWVKFFHIRLPQLEGLAPILDSMTYREELPDFPEDYYLPEPRFCLLATSDRFFIWDASDWGQDGLFIAGATLEEVYNGLKDWRWAESSEDPWEMADEEGEYLDPVFYFVTYHRKPNGNFGINRFPEEFPGRKRKGLLDGIFRGLGI
jgi:hypothetical protein